MHLQIGDSREVMRYTPLFLPHELEHTAYEALMEDLAWERRDGAPRAEYWTNIFNQPYTYGRGAGERTYQSHVTHPAIEAITDRLETLLDFRYEGCFLNRYDTARDALGWHADDDPGIDHRRPIAVVTLGHGREIQIKRQHVETRVGVLFDSGVEPTIHKCFLEPGSLFLMQPGVQSTHFHRIPKASFETGPRISLTYRSLIRKGETWPA